MAPTIWVCAAAVALALARGAAAQGVQGLTYSSSTCPAGLITACTTSGFNYVYGAAGNIVFMPLAVLPQ